MSLFCGTIVSVLASTIKVINYFEKGGNVVILSVELIRDGVGNLKQVNKAAILRRRCEDKEALEARSLCKGARRI
jgi:hypothetical protein